MTTSLGLTIADLEVMPLEDGTRYELIDGELHVTHQPSTQHQIVCSTAVRLLEDWGERTGAGVAFGAPGVLFSERDAVAPDAVWVSRERLSLILEPDGKLHAAPELMVEVLSPGPINEKRDRETKLRLYSSWGVREYWIVDWERRQMDVYRRDNGALFHAATLYEADTLESPLLPGFLCPVTRLFSRLP